MQKKRALVQDDHKALRSAAKAMLTMKGFDVDEAEDGLRGFELARANKYDLIVSDVEMPNMNGFEFIARCRKEASLQKTPIVLCTTLNKPEHIEKAKKVGATTYVVKPMTSSNLEQVLRALGFLP